jgi:hypothetical protein
LHNSETGLNKSGKSSGIFVSLNKLLQGKKHYQPKLFNNFNLAEGDQYAAQISRFA